MGMVSLWAELLYGGGGGGGALTPFIEQRFGPASLGLRSGPMYMSFPTP